MPLGRRDFVQALLVGAGAAACQPRESTHRVTRDVPRESDVCRDSPRRFSVLTWNIFMMPGWVHASPSNRARASLIADVLLAEDFDILCLQKVFDTDALHTLEDKLASRYPYRFGPANERSGVKLNSGVYVLSRVPLVDQQAIEFEACGGVECLSRKGAMLLSGRCGNRAFRLVATHLQGEEGNAFTVGNTRVRQLQMVQIATDLVAENLEQGVPFLFCGDFGTPRFEGDGPAETDAYRAMLATLGAENGAWPRITLDETAFGNTLAQPGGGRRNELDYVLVRPNGARVSITRDRRIFRRAGWDTGPRNRPDLSYRYAVAAVVDIA